MRLLLSSTQIVMIYNRKLYKPVVLKPFLKITLLIVFKSQLHSKKSFFFFEIEKKLNIFVLVFINMYQISDYKKGNLHRLKEPLLLAIINEIKGICGAPIAKKSKGKNVLEGQVQRPERHIILNLRHI